MPEKTYEVEIYPKDHVFEGGTKNPDRVKVLEDILFPTKYANMFRKKEKGMICQLRKQLNDNPEYDVKEPTKFKLPRKYLRF